GPMIPLFCVGPRMLGHFPLVPIAWELGVGLGVTSYNQKLYFGYMGDAGAGPDVQRLKEFTDQAYIELRSAAGVEKSDLPQLGVATEHDTSRHQAGASHQALAADAG
ncbi:MAG TPA: WS/DGAT domain-containing protein, partial [Dehalococcoidia bacterium]